MKTNQSGNHKRKVPASKLEERTSEAKCRRPLKRAKARRARSGSASTAKLARDFGDLGDKRIELKRDGEVRRYSARERKVFDLILTMANGSIDGADSIEITKRMFRSQPAPIYGLIVVTNLIRALKKKMEVNREPYTIKSTPRSGPHPMRHKIVMR